MIINCYPFNKRNSVTIVLLVTIITVLLLGTIVQAEEKVSGIATTGPTEKIFLNGEIIAKEISKTTGVAISPILGISVLGAYTYYTTPVAERDLVPWHARPAFWAPLLVVLLGILLKDSSKIALPKIILIPLDAVETLLEKNASAALALLAILSSITSRGLEKLQLSGGDMLFSLIPSAHAADSINSAATAGVVELWLLSMLVTLIFGIVWVVSQSFNFLIMLSPSSWLDLLLTLSKNFVISILLGAYLISPYLGLTAAMFIIIISLFLFARSYRFVIFGTLFSADIVFRRSYRKRSGKIKAFAGSSVPDTPSLSYGKLAEEGNQLVFCYRPWLIMPLRKIKTSFSCDNCEVGKATLAPVIITPTKGAKKYTTLFRLRPLYKSHENLVAEILKLNGIRDVSFGRSMKEGFKWLGEQLGLVPRKKHETL